MEDFCLGVLSICGVDVVFCICWCVAIGGLVGSTVGCILCSASVLNACIELFWVCGTEFFSRVCFVLFVVNVCSVF